MDTAECIRQLQARIDALPRARICALPTPVMPLPRLAAHAGTGRLIAKRDDLTGVGLGGNKSRELEFILADAQSQGCDTLIAGGGGVQSNHAVQCAAAANRVGMKSVIVLRRRPAARRGGNLLLDGLFGTTIEWIDSDSEFRNRNQASSRMHELAADLRSAGHRPYVLESSLHPLAVVAYANALLELVTQLPGPIGRPTRLYVTSEGATLGGLVLAAGAIGLEWEIVGLDWRPWQESVRAAVVRTIGQAAILLGLPEGLVPGAALTILPTGGPAYGVGNPLSWKAMSTAALLEGVVLDPVYTAKGMAGALEDLANRPIAQDGQVIFVHTGGVGALFSYEADIRRNIVDAAMPIVSSTAVPLTDQPQS